MSPEPISPEPLVPRNWTLYPAHFVAWVELERTPGAGDFERAYVADPSGSIANPRKDAAMVEKFHNLMADLMPAEQASDLQAAVLGAAPLGARELVRHLAPTRTRSAAE